MLLKKGSVEFKMIVFEDLKDHMPLMESGYYYRPVEMHIQRLDLPVPK